MAQQINPVLLERLAAKLGITPKSVYVRIQDVANRMMLDRHLAAMVLAAESGIGIQRFATAEDLAVIRGQSSGRKSAVESSPNAQVKTNPKPGKQSRQRRATKAEANSVFVVHGRDEALRKSMFEFLRSLGLNPMEWSTAVLRAKRGANPYVGEVINSAMDRVQAVVVLFSPDELAHLKTCFQTREDKPSERKPQGQARPNVIFEAGLALGSHPRKTLLVQVGSMRPISDIAGMHIVRLTNDVAKRQDVAKRLRSIGCPINLDGNDWMRVGHFEPTTDKPVKASR